MSRVKYYFDDGYEENFKQGNSFWYSGVVISLEVGEVWVVKRDESCWEEMYESGGEQDIGIKMMNSEKEVFGDVNDGEFEGDYGQSVSQFGDGEDDNQGVYMKWYVVVGGSIVICIVVIIVLVFGELF